MLNHSKLAILALLGNIQAQELFDNVVLPKNIENTITDVIKPLTDYMEPYKTFSETKERGIPLLHESYGKFLIIFLFTFRLSKNSR